MDSGLGSDIRGNRTLRRCGKRFVRNFGFEKVKATPEAVTSALQLYFTGESLLNVQKFLRLQGVRVSHRTVYNWIRSYVSFMEKYLDKLTPQVSDVRRADELYLKIKGNMKYVYALMDDQTSGWPQSRKFLITDGAPNFHDAYMRELRTNLYDSSKHIKEIRMSGTVHNNKMERMNGEVRDREKVMRGLKKPETPIISGYQIYHNYVRSLEALEGKTPAEVCGIEVQGENKWLTLIQNASRKQK